MDPDSIEAMRTLIEQGGLDLDPDRDLVKDPVPFDEVLNTIDACIRRRPDNTNHPIYPSLAEQIERLRAQSNSKSRGLHRVPQTSTGGREEAARAEGLEAEGHLDECDVEATLHQTWCA